MSSPDIPSIFMLLKKATKGNPSINVNSEKVLFAFTNKAVEDVILNEYSSFEKSGGMKRLNYVLGEGLITSEEPKHMHNKKEIAPTFHNNHMVEYENKISAIIDSLLSNWHDEVDVRKEMGFFVFKSILEIFFSESMDEYFPEARGHVSLASYKIANNIFDDELFDSKEWLREFSKNIVDKRLESKEIKNDFLDIIINSYNNKKIDLEGLYDEAITMLLVGYETTAFALEWAVYYLSINKDWQEKISREENVDAFINEVLRMCPPIWNEQRVAIKDVNIDGIDIVAGTQVMVSSLAIHRDKDVFEDPDTFKPERWFDKKDLSKGEYFPFLFGKRQCIGKEFALMEMRIMLIKIAKKFTVDLVSENIGNDATISYKTKNPTMIIVKGIGV
jgi:cytochrome P450